MNIFKLTNLIRNGLSSTIWNSTIFSQKFLDKTFSRDSYLSSSVSHNSISFLVHQCRKGFWPRLFSSFCLGFRPKAYWDETKRRNLWSRLQRNRSHRGTFLLRVCENQSHLHAPAAAAFSHRATNLQQRTKQQCQRTVHHGGSQCHQRRSWRRHPLLRRLHPWSSERRRRLRWMRECCSVWRVQRATDNDRSFSSFLPNAR